MQDGREANMKEKRGNKFLEFCDARKTPFFARKIRGRQSQETTSERWRENTAAAV